MPHDTSPPLSAVLITLDGERWLDDVLASLSCCDQIVVLDSGSTDATRAIAARYGAQWFERDFDGYGPQKRAAVALAEHDWILSVDADEILEIQSARAISEINWPAQDPAACWRIRRRPFVGNREIHHGHWVPDPVVRLFNRTVHNFSSGPVHESVHPLGPVHQLPGALIHHSYPDLASVFRGEHHRLKAAEYRRRGRPIPGTLRLTGRALWAFLYSFVRKRGYRDGPAGVVIALSASVNAVLGLALAGEGPSRSQRKTDDKRS